MVELANSDHKTELELVIRKMIIDWQELKPGGEDESDQQHRSAKLMLLQLYTFIKHFINNKVLVESSTGWKEYVQQKRDDLQMFWARHIIDFYL